MARRFDRRTNRFTISFAEPPDAYGLQRIHELYFSLLASLDQLQARVEVNQIFNWFAGTYIFLGSNKRLMATIRCRISERFNYSQYFVFALGSASLQ